MRESLAFNADHAHFVPATLHHLVLHRYDRKLTLTASQENNVEEQVYVRRTR